MDAISIGQLDWYSFGERRSESLNQISKSQPFQHPPQTSTQEGNVIANSRIYLGTTVVHPGQDSKYKRTRAITNDQETNFPLHPTSEGLVSCVRQKNASYHIHGYSTVFPRSLVATQRNRGVPPTEIRPRCLLRTSEPARAAASKRLFPLAPWGACSRGRGGEG